MKLRNKKRLIVFTVLLSVILNWFSPHSVLYTTETPTGNEIASDKVNLSLQDIYIQEGASKFYLVQGGSSVADSPKVLVGDHLHLKWNWEISNTQGMKAGDFFIVPIDLAPGKLLPLDVMERPIYQAGTDIQFGTFSVQNKAVRITLNKKVEEESALTDGWLEVMLKAVEAGTANFHPNGVSHTVSIAESMHPNYAAAENQSDQVGIHPNDLTDSLPLIKNTNNEPDKAYWQIIVNRDGLYRYLLSNEKAIPVMERVVVEDILFKDQMVLFEGTGSQPHTHKYTMAMTAEMHIPIVDAQGKVIGISSDRIDGFKMEKTFEGEIVRKNDGESYVQFRERMRSQPAMTLGIYDGEHTQNILFALGNIGANGQTYAEWFAQGEQGFDQAKAKFDAMLDAASDPTKRGQKGYITKAQAKKMKELYGGPILSYNIDFRTIPQKGQSNYSNFAKLYADVQGEQVVSASSHSKVYYAGAAAGVQTANGNQGMMLHIEKIWQTPADRTDKIEVQIWKRLQGEEEGKAVLEKTLSLSEETGWYQQIIDLPERDASNTEYLYEVREIVPEGFEHPKISKKVQEDKAYQNKNINYATKGVYFSITNTKKSIIVPPTVPKPETPNPETPKPETPKPETPKPETPKPETPKPETPKPEEPKPEIPNPEEPKPETPNPEEPKPEEPKPEEPSEPIRVTITDLPDPKSSDSPAVIEVVDESGTPLGVYRKVTNDYGEEEYVDENNIPLGKTRIPKTSDDFKEGLFLGAAVLALVLLGMLHLKKDKNRL